MSDVLDTRPPAGAARTTGRGLAVLVTVLTAAFMDFLDNGIVVLAAPAIQADLGGGSAAMEMTIAGYTLAFALGLVTGGRLGDIVGRKKMFLLGTALFVVTSLGCGPAPSIELLIVARVLQGLSAAAMVPQVLAIIKSAFPPPERLKGPLAAFGAMSGVANVSGPLIAGVLIEHDFAGLGWRVVFLINVPVGVLVLGAALLLVSETRSARPPTLDLLGVGVVTLALLLLLFPLVEGPTLDWPAWIFLVLAASAPVFAWFWSVERCREQQGRSPLLPPSVFANRTLLAGLVVHVLLFSGIASFFMISTITLQAGLDFTVLAAGMTSLPWPIAITVFSGIGLAFVAKLGRNLLSLGAVIMVAGMATLMWSALSNGAELEALDLAPGLALSGIGMAFIAPSLMDLVLAGAGNRDAGAISGVLNTALQVGTALGIALLGVIFFGRLETHGAAQTEHVIDDVRAAAASANVPDNRADDIAVAFGRCFRDHFGEGEIRAMPESCGDAGRLLSAYPELGAAVTEVTDHHRGEVFTRAFAESLLYNVGVFGASFLLIFFLPRRMTAPEPSAENPDTTRNRARPRNHPL